MALNNSKEEPNCLPWVIEKQLLALKDENDIARISNEGIFPCPGCGVVCNIKHIKERRFRGKRRVIGLDVRFETAKCIHPILKRRFMDPKLPKNKPRLR